MFQKLVNGLCRVASAVARPMDSVLSSVGSGFARIFKRINTFMPRRTVSSVSIQMATTKAGVFSRSVAWFRGKKIVDITISSVSYFYAILSDLVIKSWIGAITFGLLMRVGAIKLFNVMTMIILATGVVYLFVKFVRWIVDSVTNLMCDWQYGPVPSPEDVIDVTAQPAPV